MAPTIPPIVMRRLAVSFTRTSHRQTLAESFSDAGHSPLECLSLLAFRARQPDLTRMSHAKLMAIFIIAVISPATKPTGISARLRHRRRFSKDTA